MSNKVYDVLKYITLVGIPAVATLYSAIASTWNLPCATEVTSTATAVCTALGSLLMISSAKYKKGEDKNE